MVLSKLKFLCLVVFKFSHTHICCFPDVSYPIFLKIYHVCFPPISVSIFVSSSVQLSMEVLLGVVVWGSMWNRRYQFQLMKFFRIQIYHFIVNIKWPKTFKRFVLCRYACHSWSLFVLEQYPHWKWCKSKLVYTIYYTSDQEL